VILGLCALRSFHIHRYRIAVPPSHASPESEFLSPARRRWFVPVVGYVDDAAVIAWVLKALLTN